ncbi:hypothetical protein RND81_08G058900 [Saponaria officinalis]|uniref:GH18 domain-containing protein n=1 Tax=Saponaria officinalis TaxID=3572 RepID=A0AAW1J4S2_SAPOF
MLIDLRMKMELRHYHLLGFFVTLLCLQTTFAQTAVKAGYWFPDSGIAASDIDSTLFTHLFCAFANLNPTTNQLSISAECSSFTKTVQQNNPSVKTLLSIGGGSAHSSFFNTMASQPASRKTFIASSINLARSNGFLGLDLDWENQTTSGEMSNLGTLLTEWRASLNAEATNTGRQPLVLTAALAVIPRITRFNPPVTYPATVIAKTLDWVNVMAYDFYDPNVSPTTRSNAALRDPTGGVSGSSGISAWINAGVPAKQLVLGFPYYGYAWKLVNPNNNGLLAPANGADRSVGDKGTLDYNEIKEFIRQKQATVVFNSSYGTNYCYSGSTWINYDDTQTVAAKVSYAKTNGLLGYFAWNLAQDHNWALSKEALHTWCA